MDLRAKPPRMKICWVPPGGEIKNSEKWCLYHYFENEFVESRNLKCLKTVNTLEDIIYLFNQRWSLPPKIHVDTLEL